MDDFEWAAEHFEEIGYVLTGFHDGLRRLPLEGGLRKSRPVDRSSAKGHSRQHAKT